MRLSLLPALLLAGCTCESSLDSSVESSVKPSAAPSVAREDPNDPKVKYRLTDEEKQLLEADPKTLTKDQLRARSHASRKQIMQNPDSPSAKALEDLRRRVESGELQPPPRKGGGLRLEARKKPENAEAKSADAQPGDAKTPQ